MGKETRVNEDSGKEGGHRKDLEKDIEGENQKVSLLPYVLQLGGLTNIEVASAKRNPARVTEKLRMGRIWPGPVWRCPLK
jgi:hypothetical protein